MINDKVNQLDLNFISCNFEIYASYFGEKIKFSDTFMKKYTSTLNKELVQQVL